MNYMQEPKEITHIKYYMNQIERLEMVLSDEEMGKLFFAVGRYARTGEKEDMERNLIFPYNELTHAIDKQRMRIGNGWR